MPILKQSTNIALYLSISIGILLICAGPFLAMSVFLTVVHHNQRYDTFDVFAASFGGFLFFAGVALVVVPMLVQISLFTPKMILDRSCYLLLVGFSLVLATLTILAADFVAGLHESPRAGYSRGEVMFISDDNPDIRPAVAVGVFALFLPGMFLITLGLLWLLMYRRRFRVSSIQPPFLQLATDLDALPKEGTRQAAVGDDRERSTFESTKNRSDAIRSAYGKRDHDAMP